MRIAVTGHMNITADTEELVYRDIAERLRRQSDVVGVSCIARGADTVFARAVLDRGGQLEVLLPSVGYREQKVKPDHLPVFDELLERAGKVTVMPFEAAGRDAYEAANNALLDSCDVLYAVWDGRVGERGGTATVVEEATERGVPVEVIWPDGAARRA
jgi:hypothetical protein